MADANVKLTITVHNKTTEGILPYLMWALENKLKAVVSFEEEDDPKALAFQEVVQETMARYQTPSGMGFNLENARAILNPDLLSGSEQDSAATPTTGKGDFG